MPTLLLVRHGRTTANADGTLAGRREGVELDDEGRRQAESLAARLAELPVVAIVTSPQTRCRQTAAVIAGAGGTRRVPRPAPVVDDGFAECDYGAWSGRPLSELAREQLWKVVQGHPSAAAFPEGESLRAMQNRAVDAVRRHDEKVAAVHRQDALWVAVSHGDVIKSVLADALAMHLDAFQRIVVDPCSVSVVQYTPLRPFVLRTNDTGGSVASLLPRPRRGRPRAASDAVVGGGRG